MTTHEAALDRRPRLRRVLASPHFKLAASCFVLYVFYADFGLVSDNSQVRYALTKAIVDDASFRVDRYTQMMGLDRAVYKGHTYCDKPPGSSFLMAPQYLLAKLLVPRRIFGAWQEIARAWVTTVLSVCLYAALSVALLYEVLGLLGVSRGRVLWCYAYAVGTLVFPYSTILLGEPTTAALVIAAAWLALRGESRSDLIWLGVVVGLTFVTHYHAILIVGWLIPLKWATLEDKRRISWAVAPALAFLGLQLAYNWVCFDGPLHMSYSYWQGGKAKLQFNLPTLWQLRLATFSSWRGIFYYCPWLVFFFAGLPVLWAKRRVWAVCLAVQAAAYVGFLLLNNQADGHAWWIGNDFGPRQFVPIVPVLAIGAIVGLDALFGRARESWLRRGAVAVFACAVAFSVVVCSIGALTSPKTHVVTYAGGSYYVQDNAESPKIKLDGVRHLPFGFTLKLLLGKGSSNLLTESIVRGAGARDAGLGPWLLNMATNGVPLLVIIILWWGRIGEWLLRRREVGR